MKHADAFAIAHSILTSLQPHCQRVKIAGSLRRQKPEVRDIELVAVPREVLVVTGTNLFEETREMQSAVYLWAKDAADLGITWIKTGTDEIIPWAPKPDAKYLRGVVAVDDAQIKLDLFLVRPESWGIQFLIRTGSADFSKAVVTHARAIGKPMAGGILTDAATGEDIPTLSEGAAFEALGLRYVEPCDRHGAAQVQPLRSRFDAYPMPQVLAEVTR